MYSNLSISAWVKFDNFKNQLFQYDVTRANLATSFTNFIPFIIYDGICIFFCVILNIAPGRLWQSVGVDKHFPHRISLMHDKLLNF